MSLVYRKMPGAVQKAAAMNLTGFSKIAVLLYVWYFEGP